jgi:hypothetical protein
MQPFGNDGYTSEQVVRQLQAVTGGRDLRFRYELLDSNNNFLRPLTGVLSGSIQFDASADVKRTGTFTLREGVDSIDYLNNRIKPWVGVSMPDGGIREWPQGVFLLSAPSRTLSPSGVTVRSVQAYDQAVILSGDGVGDRYSIPAGKSFTAAIADITTGLGFGSFVTPSSLTLPVTWDYEAGTSKLTILNDLLSAMNYRSAWFEEGGYLVCEPYVTPGNRAVSYTYATDSTSVITGDVSDDIDLFSIPNKWVLVVSDTDQGSFSSTYTNTSASSPTSTVSRGRTILKFMDGQSAADQASLDGLAARTAYEDSQVFENVSFTTALMPVHSNADILALSVGGLNLGDARFEELSWGMELRAGATMSHVVRRSLPV